MSLKFDQELCAMTMKNDARSEEELTCHFKIDIRNLTTTFDQPLKSLKNLNFNWLLLTKINSALAKKVHSSYLS